MRDAEGVMEVGFEAEFALSCKVPPPNIIAIGCDGEFHARACSIWVWADRSLSAVPLIV